MTEATSGTPSPQNRSELGWWAISGEALLAMLRRCYAGEEPDLVYAEEYANSHVDNYRSKEE